MWNKKIEKNRLRYIYLSWCVVGFFSFFLSPLAGGQRWPLVLSALPPADEGVERKCCGEPTGHVGPHQAVLVLGQEGFGAHTLSVGRPRPGHWSSLPQRGGPLHIRRGHPTWLVSSSLTCVSKVARLASAFCFLDHWQTLWHTGHWHHLLPPLLYVSLFQAVSQICKLCFYVFRIFFFFLTEKIVFLKMEH